MDDKFQANRSNRSKILAKTRNCSSQVDDVCRVSPKKETMCNVHNSRTDFELPSLSLLNFRAPIHVAMLFVFPDQFRQTARPRRRCNRTGPRLAFRLGGCVAALLLLFLSSHVGQTSAAAAPLHLVRQRLPPVVDRPPLQRDAYPCDPVLVASLHTTLYFASLPSPALRLVAGRRGLQAKCKVSIYY